MANIALKNLVLFDNWPGTPNPNLSIPTNNWDNTVDNDVTAPTWPVGTKIMAYEDSTWNPGYYTMIYLGYLEGTDLDTPLSDGSAGFRICTHAETTVSNDGTQARWCTVTNDCTNSDATRIGQHPIAIACTSLTDVGAAGVVTIKYGWFWGGGVCPVGDITGFNHDLTGTAAAGAGFVLADDGGNGISITTAEGTGERIPVGWTLRATA